jgi:hypothetical protein
MKKRYLDLKSHQSGGACQVTVEGVRFDCTTEDFDRFLARLGLFQRDKVFYELATGAPWRPRYNHALVKHLRERVMSQRLMDLTQNTDYYIVMRDFLQKIHSYPLYYHDSREWITPRNSRSFNIEHVVPRNASFMPRRVISLDQVNSSPPSNDPNIIRYADTDVNRDRSSMNFGYANEGHLVDSGTSRISYPSSRLDCGLRELECLFEPSVNRKGDVGRIMLYYHLIYGMVGTRVNSRRQHYQPEAYEAVKHGSQFLENYYTGNILFNYRYEIDFENKIPLYYYWSLCDCIDGSTDGRYNLEVIRRFETGNPFIGYLDRNGLYRETLYSNSNNLIEDLFFKGGSSIDPQYRDIYFS